MFDFEKLEVYQVVKEANTSTFRLVNALREIDGFVAEQWKRASLSSMLNLQMITIRNSLDSKT